MRQKGSITSWNDVTGVGFVKPYSGGKPIFVNLSGFNRDPGILYPGNQITFSIDYDRHGNPFAKSATIAGQRLKKQTKKSRQPLQILFALLFLLSIVAITYIGQSRIELLFLFLISSLLSILFYAYDKAAARNGYRRIQERTLHILSLTGGWPGAILAQQWFRHKTVKMRFRTAFWFTVSLNITFYLLTFSRKGQLLLDMLLVTLSLNATGSYVG